MTHNTFNTINEIYHDTIKNNKILAHIDHSIKINTLKILSNYFLKTKEQIEKEYVKNEKTKKELVKKETVKKETVKKEPIIKEPVKKNKKHISATVKRLVWNTYIGENIGKAKCTCCNVTDITQMSFHCGHIIAEVNGGDIIVSNLKPICQNCNSSMGTKNMNDFILQFK